MIVWILGIGALVAGYWIAYLSSAASDARRRARAVVSGLRTFLRRVDDAHGQSSTGQSRVSQAYITEVRQLRLRAIKVEEMKRHASGLRLSALRNAGIDDLSQMQGWGAQRLMQIKGIGPDSARRIASLVSTLSEQVNQQPIPHPVEARMTLSGYKLMEAIQIDIETQMTFRDLRPQLQQLIATFQAREAGVLTNTGFFTWLPGFRSSPKLQGAIVEARVMEADLQHSEPASSLCQTLSIHLDRLAGMRRSGMEPTTVDEAVKGHPDWFHRALNALLGERPTAQLMGRGLGGYKGEQAPELRSGVLEARLEMQAGNREPSESPTTQDPTAFWVGPGGSITVLGQLISGGMVYVGSGLASVRGHSIEPALIDPKRTVQIQGADYQARQTNYWPTYESLAPRARGAYLKWLAGGKSDPRADIGFVFLYFYGLERRLVHDLARASQDDPEVLTILTEVRRLLGIFSGNGSFHAYATSLLDYISARGLAGIPPIPAAVPEISAAFGPSQELKLGLAVHSTRKLPIPPAWALAWLQSIHFPRTAATRCPREFQKLFALEYGKQFGNGLVVPENKTRMKIQHRTASPSFGSILLEVPLDLPDIAVQSSPLVKLQEVAVACYVQLDAYSRFLGRNPDKAGTLEALLLLPPTLWPEAVSRELVNLKRQLEESTDPIVIPFVELQLRLPEGGELNKAKFTALSRALGSLGMGIEPDPRFGGALPDLDEAVVLFQGKGLEQDRPVSQGFLFGALAVHLASIVAHSDGDFAEAEVALLTGQMAQWLHLNDADRARLLARLQLMRKTKPVLTGIQKRLDALSTEQKLALANLLVLLTHADGAASPAEVKVLEKVFRMLGQNEGTVYARLHGAAAEPVTVRPAQVEGISYKLPPRPPAPIPSHPGMTLDMAKVAALRAESAKVSDLLGSIFKEDDTPLVQVPDTHTHESADEPCLLGLDPDHAGLLQALLSRSQWSRDELEDLCSDRGLMVDGALERINEAALEALDEPIIEGEDPLDVRCDLLLDRTA